MRSSSAASPPTLRVVTSLRLDERVLVRCDDGLLGAEYALFDVSDIVLRATDPVTVREAGYMTTAQEALERLIRAGVTPDLSRAAAKAIAPKVAASFARGAAARAVAPRLTAHELFEGAVYHAATQHYEGAWLDLDALANALPVATAPVLLQALHLAAALSEVAPATPLHMSTAAATRDRRPGERTHQRVALEAAHHLPQLLRQLVPHPHAIEVEPGRERRMRQALLARVRERASVDATPQLRAHLSELESALALRTMPLSPLADPELRAIERQLASGDLQGVVEQLDQLEQVRGAIPGIRYLRARAALLRGEEPPRSIAQALSRLADEQHGFHEAELGAARTWLAAGEDGHARYFAHKLAEDSSATDSERLVAIEILDSTTDTNRSHAPPPVGGSAELVTVPRVPVPRVHLFPSLGDVPPPPGFGGSNAPSFGGSSTPPASGFGGSSTPPMPPNFEQEEARGFGEGAAGTGASPEKGHGYGGSSTPPERADVEQRTGRPPRGGMHLRYAPELVESLALPYGASEDALGANEVPKTALHVRIAMTRLARDLARDYRLWYGKSLRCNVLAVDAMQQHLAHRLAGAPISEPGVAWELRRHGALLSEILARALGAIWVDIAPSEPGYWAMLIPPATRSWPIGRVYRFLALGQRERDLVSYYLDLEARVRQAESDA